MKYLIVLTLVIITACATPYQKSGFSGGFSETRLANDMYEVTFNGNGYTGSQTVKNYLLRRCAELTQINGYTHFLPISRDASEDTSYSTSYNSTTNQATTYTITKHENSMVIKMLNHPTKNMIAYDAALIYPLNREPSSEIRKKDTGVIGHLFE